MDLLVLIDVGYLGCLFVGWVRWLRLLACYDIQNFVKWSVDEIHSVLHILHVLYVLWLRLIHIWLWLNRLLRIHLHFSGYFCTRHSIWESIGRARSIYWCKYWGWRWLESFINKFWLLLLVIMWTYVFNIAIIKVLCAVWILLVIIATLAYFKLLVNVSPTLWLVALWSIDLPIELIGLRFWKSRQQVWFLVFLGHQIQAILLHLLRVPILFLNSVLLTPPSSSWRLR